MAASFEHPDQPEVAKRFGAAGRTMSLLERIQDVVTFVAGGALALLAAALLVAAVVDFCTAARHDMTAASTHFLDRTLLVLILVEVVHTVVLSLRRHALVPEPFIVVGLIAVVRKLLLVLAGTTSVPPTTLALLVAMLAVFIAGLVTLRLIHANRGEEAQEGI